MENIFLCLETVPLFILHFNKSKRSIKKCLLFFMIVIVMFVRLKILKNTAIMCLQFRNVSCSKIIICDKIKVTILKTSNDLTILKKINIAKKHVLQQNNTRKVSKKNSNTIFESFETGVFAFYWSVVDALFSFFSHKNVPAECFFPLENTLTYVFLLKRNHNKKEPKSNTVEADIMFYKKWNVTNIFYVQRLSCYLS